MYELMLKDRMRFSIPRLIRDVCNHYEIAPSQLMSNAWRVLMSLESLSVRHGVDCELGEVMFSYYLKEHDVDKGCYKLIARAGRVPIITCLHTNDHGWKDKYLFVKGNLVWGPHGPSGMSGHWKSTSKEILYFVPPCRLTLILVICVGRDFNRALPSG